MTEHFQLVICIPEEWYDLPDWIMRHYSVAFKRESVWFGKPDPAIPPRDVHKLRAQIKAGVPTLVAITNPHSNNKIVYVAALLGVSSELPKKKELLPPFYEELQILSRMKTWLKLGYPIEGFRLEEFPDLEKAIATYNKHESKLLKKGPVVMPGYFFLMLD
jgi:hypothetical protein